MADGFHSFKNFLLLNWKHFLIRIVDSLYKLFSLNFKPMLWLFGSIGNWWSCGSQLWLTQKNQLAKSRGSMWDFVVQTQVTFIDLPNQNQWVWGGGHKSCSHIWNKHPAQEWDETTSTYVKSVMQIWGTYHQKTEINSQLVFIDEQILAFTSSD